MKKKRFGKNFLLKLKEKLNENGETHIEQSEIYSLYATFSECITADSKKQYSILKSFFNWHKIPYRKAKNILIFDKNSIEKIKEKVDVFCKKKKEEKSIVNLTLEKTEQKIIKDYFEIIVLCNNADETALGTLSGGKVVQSKGEKLYKIIVPLENKKKLFSFWINSEVNGFGTVMIDVDLEKEFTKVLEKL